MSRAIVTVKTIPYSALIEGLRRFSEWPEAQVPTVAVWEVFGWSDEDLVQILDLLDIPLFNINNESHLDGFRLLSGLSTGSTLISVNNKRSFKIRLPELYALALFPKLPVMTSLVQTQAAYPYYCPIHETRTSQCQPFRFHEIFFMYLLWHHSHVLDAVKYGRIHCASAGEKLQLDLRNMIVSKMLPFFKADLTRLLDAVNSSSSCLATWLSSPAVRQGATLARLIGAASPCVSKYYCARIDADFTANNEMKLRILAQHALSHEDLAIIDVAAKGLPLTRIPRAQELAKEVCVGRVPFRSPPSEKESSRIPRHDVHLSPPRWDHLIKIELPRKETKSVTQTVSEVDSVIFGTIPKLPRAVDGEDYDRHWRRMLKAKSVIGTGNSIRYERARNWMPEAGYYARADYWDERYKNGTSEGATDEWIFSFEALQKLLPIKEARDIVDVGCGISSLLAEIRKSGFQGSLTGIDFSKSGVEKAAEMYSSSNISYIAGDASELTKLIGVESADLILDKTMIDSILCAGPAGRATVTQYCQQVGKALREDGAFIWCSFQSLSPYGQDILDGIIVPGLTSSNDYHGLGWTLDIHSWENYATNKDLNPTIYVFKKVHRSPRFLGDDVSVIETSMNYY